MLGIARDITERKRAERRTAELLAIAKDIGGAYERDVLLNRVQRRAAAALPCDCVATFYLDPVANVVRMVSQYGGPPELLEEAGALTFGPGELSNGILESGRTVVINDIAAQSWLPAELLASFGISAVVVVPMRVRDRYLGALVATNLGPGRPFDPGQVELCEGIARQLAVALEAVELYRAQQDEAEVAGALARVGRALISSLNAPVLLDRLCRLTTEVLECDSSHTFFHRPEDDAWIPLATYGYPSERTELIRVLNLPSELFAGVLSGLTHQDTMQVDLTQSSKPLVVEFVQRFGIKAILYMALRRGQEIIGLHVACLHRPGARFQPKHERIGRGIAQLASLALENVRLVEQLDRASRLKSEFVATMSHELSCARR